MALSSKTQKTLKRDLSISLLIYTLPVLAIYLYFKLNNGIVSESHLTLPSFLEFAKPVFANLQTWGLPVFMIVIGIIEFAAGLYDDEWTGEERKIDIVSFLAPKLIFPPVIAFFSLTLLPVLFPNFANTLSWVPFWGGFFLIAVADDLTQYWYHRLHHQVPFLWRFHRTHHSAPYMGIAMLNRQNFIYTVFFSQIYLTATLVYLGLGLPALFVGVLKSIIIIGAHSSIAWDKPFYKYKVLHPIAWVLERLISTPATHHAHHADTSGDGIGNFKGNFGNMFFIWDIIFGTGLITRKFPKSYGIRSYKQEEWYAQFLWPIFKSKKEGSALAEGVLSIPVSQKKETVLVDSNVYEQVQS
ncbi:sterol desaturase family protein [Flavobacterium aquicola]|uniref:Fatty acid hydroxylase family protein n=1 Tax=Flavobacterium aquicola TaxID=1682742 RepID=A0A3E0ERR5_9FLAO|nr:sterol desaturase family protein [Flavobacterium aquicola]REH00484.1 fatty acid hydroxylase family protein [Flavobacterium aquicola]